MNAQPLTEITRSLRIQQRRFATGDITKPTHLHVRVTCRTCGGETVFPVQQHQSRPTPAQCAHCGAEI